MPGTGKSLCTDLIVKQGIPSLYFGGITIDEINRRGLAVNEANEKIVREELRKDDPAFYAKEIIKKIEGLFRQGHQKVIADGLYSWSEYKVFKSRFGDKVAIIAIAAPLHIRHSRLAIRPTRPLSEEEVMARDYAEIENLEKGGPIANADYTVVNDETVEKLEKNLLGLLKEIGLLK